MFKKSVQKFKVSKKTAIVAVVVLFLAVTAVVGLLIYNKEQSNSSVNASAVFTIDGKNYSPEEVEKIITYPVNKMAMSKNDATKLAYDNLVQIRAAEVNKVMPPSDFVDRYKKDANNALKTDTLSSEDVATWANLVGTVDAINASLKQASPAGIAGYSYVFYFGQHQQFDRDNKVAGAGDQSLIKADRSAADKKAKEYHRMLKNKEISNKDLLDRILKDTPSNIFWYSTQFNSSNAEPWDTKVYFAPIVDYIKGQTATGVSELKTGQAASTVTGNNEDMYFYFVDMTSVPGATMSSENFAKKVQELPQNYKGFAQ